MQMFSYDKIEITILASSAYKLHSFFRGYCFLSNVSLELWPAVLVT